MTMYIVSVATLSVIFAIVALALNVRWGWAGEFDFFVYGLVALGAYTDAVVTLPRAPKNDVGLRYILGLHQPWIVGAVAAMVTTSFISLIVGAVALRALRQIYFAIATFTAVLILATVIGQQTGLFNGFTGVFSVPQPFKTTLNLSYAGYGYFFLGFSLVLLLVVYLVLERLFWSPFGLVLRAIREDEDAAAVFGYNAYLLRLKAYVLGGAVAGLAGSLLVAYLTAFNTDAWSPTETILIFAALIVGGTGNGAGAILGSLLIFGVVSGTTQYLPSFFGNSNAPAAFRAIAIAVLVIAFLRFRPQGLLPERHVIDRPPWSSRLRSFASIGRRAAAKGGQ
jgi:branched-chain amino acid transport system permease protein